MPSYLRGWLNGIVSAGERVDKTGILIWKEPGARDDGAVVVLRLKDWQDWHGNDQARTDQSPGITRGFES